MGLRNRRLLSAERSLPCDVVRLAQKVPLARVEASLDLAEVARHRSAAQPRISWVAVFLRAYGMVSDRCEWLRTSYMPWPIPHVYHHARTIATVAINRELDGRPRLCWGRILDPGTRSLREIQKQLDRYTERPVPEVFRKQLRLASMPSWLRRIAWWVALNVSGGMRERQIGTFSMSTLAGQGVLNREHPTICASSVTYGPLDQHGHSLVTLIYDHRLFDGAQAAHALNELRRCLTREVCAELVEHSSQQ